MIETDPARNLTPVPSTGRRPYKTPVLIRRERLSQVAAASKNASGTPPPA